MDERKRIERGWPESESKREALVEQRWERSQEGRKETNRKPSTRIWKEGMRNQAGEKEETEEARAETGIGEATVRQNREEKERKKQRLSSQNPKLRRTKECRNSGGQKAKGKRTKESGTDGLEKVGNESRRQG